MKSANKIVKSKLMGIVDGVIDQIMRIPIFVFTIIVLSFNFNVINLLFCILVFFSSVLIHELVSLFYDARHIMNLSAFSQKHNDSSFTKYQYPDLPLDFSETQMDTMSSIVYFSKSKMNLGFVCEQNDGKIMEHVSFPFYNFKPLVFLKSPMSHCKQIYQKYKVLHEIGHWCYFNYRCWVQNTTATLSFFLLISMSIFIIDSSFSLFILFVVAFFWLHQNRRCYNFCLTNEIAEVIADAFALWVLQKDEEIEVLYSYLKKYEKQRYDIMLYYKDWFESPVDIENDIFFQKFTPSKFKPRLLNNKVINFSSATEKLYIPPYRANSILLLCFIWTIAFSSITVSSNMLWAIGIISVLLLFNVIIVYLFSCLKYRQALAQLGVE